MDIIKKALFFIIVPVSIIALTSCGNTTKTEEGSKVVDKTEESSTSNKDEEIKKSDETKEIMNNVDESKQKMIKEEAKKLASGDDSVLDDHKEAYNIGKELYDQNASETAIIVYLEQKLEYDKITVAIVMQALLDNGADYVKNAKNVIEEIEAEAKQEGKTLTEDEIIKSMSDDYYFNETITKQALAETKGQSI